MAPSCFLLRVLPCFNCKTIFVCLIKYSNVTWWIATHGSAASSSSGFEPAFHTGADKLTSCMCLHAVVQIVFCIKGTENEERGQSSMLEDPVYSPMSDLKKALTK